MDNEVESFFMFVESKKEKITDRLLVSVEQLIPGINIEDLHGYSTRLSIESGIYKKRGLGSDEKNVSTECVDYIIRDSRKDKNNKYFQLLENQVVVDLGAGAWVPTTHKWISQFMPKGYVAVEPYNMGRWFPDFDYLQDVEGLVPIAAVQEGALEFLKRVPNDSVSILASGLDFFILPEDYLCALGVEIGRVLNQNGVFIKGQTTEIVPSHCNVLPVDEHARFVVYRKSS